MRFYEPDSCDDCGDCLKACPTPGFEDAAAQRLFADIREGAFVTSVLEHCTGCMSCESLCEKSAHPYGLLIERYAERYEASGIPWIFDGAMPRTESANLWSCLDKWLTPREKANINVWSRPPTGKEVLFLGCNQRITPYIADSRVFDGLEVFTAPGECCGEFYLRLGMLDEARESALSLSRRFRELGIERVIAFCPACQNTMEHLAPGILGVDFDVETVSLVDWLAERVESGRLKLDGRARGTATIQDPCHASMLDAGVAESVRELVRACGYSIREMDNCGVTAECCGIGASIARYKLRDVMATGFRRARQAAGTDASTTIAWCNGCYMIGNMFRIVYPVAPRVTHLVEAIQEASGEQPVRRMPRRAFDLLLAASEATARGLVSKATT